MKKKFDVHRIESGKNTTLFLSVKIAVLFMLLFSLQLRAGLNAQVMRLSIDLENATVKQVIQEIKNKSDFSFVYSDLDIRSIPPRSIRLTDVTVEEILDICLAGSGLSYDVTARTIVIRKSAGKQIPQAEKMKTVTGTVTDEKGQPVAGATVVIKGLMLGRATDREGRFSIEVPDREDVVLVFSFVGLKKKEMKVSGTQPLKVVMETEHAELGEVVVTGYQSINRRDMVGAYTAVKADHIMMPAYNSIDQMLQGQVAGMVVMNTSSRVGTTPAIRIRGTSTILGNREPLWVVDGVIQPDQLPFDASSALIGDLQNIIGNQISWLNPADIESVTILKDASATAVYGSKAANGVIVVTTKVGKSGKPRVNYSGNFSFQARPDYNMFNLMNSRERIQFSKEAFESGVAYNEIPASQSHTYEGLMKMYMEGDMRGEDFETQVNRLATANTDWLKLLTRNAFSHNHNIGVTGGTDKINYNASIGYSNNKGIEIRNDAEKMTGRIKLGIRFNPKFRLDMSLSTTLSTNEGYGQGVNPLEYATTTSRAIPAYDEDGGYLFYQRLMTNRYPYNTSIRYLSYNIMNEIENSYSQAKTAYVNASLNLDWNILPWLTYQFVGSVINNQSSSEAYNGEKTWYIARKYRGYDYNSVEPGSPQYRAALLPFGGEYFTNDGTTGRFSMQHKFLVSKTFRDIHRINVMLASETTTEKVKSHSNTVWGYIKERGEKIVQPTPVQDIVPINPSTDIDALGVFGNLYKRSGPQWKKMHTRNNSMSFFGTLAYSLLDRYVLNANIRSDASNRFGTDARKNFKPTWSVGVAWRVADEPWISRNTAWLNQLNLRATYGVQGNVIGSLSPDLIIRQDGLKPVFNQYNSVIMSLPNPDLTWEKTKSLDLGLDLQLFDVITMNLEYYRRTSNTIVSQQIAEEYGLSTMPINGGRITNEGVEYTINITPVSTPDIVWTIGINSSKNWNHAKDLVTEPSLYEFLSGSDNKVLKAGYPVSGFWSYAFKGLDPRTGYPEFDKLSGEGVVKEDPSTWLVYSGQTEPDFTGGLNTVFRYKGITLRADFALLIGAYKRLPNPYASFLQEKLPDPANNLNRDLIRRWKQEGDEAFTDIPALYTGGVGGSTITVPNGSYESMYDMWASSDCRVVNASFLRCRQISLTYNFPSAWCKRMRLSNLSVQAVGNNLFVVASDRFQGFDPELGDSVMPRTYSLGIKVGF